MQSLIMDSSAGYVSRINKLPDWLSYPTTARRFSVEFFSILHVIWNVKMIMVQVQECVDDHCRRPVISYTDENTQMLTPCFLPSTTLKRKHDVVEL